MNKTILRPDLKWRQQQRQERERGSGGHDRRLRDETEADEYWRTEDKRAEGWTDGTQEGREGDGSGGGREWEGERDRGRE